MFIFSQPNPQMFSYHKDTNTKFIATRWKTAGKTSTLGIENFLNRNFPKFQLIHQNVSDKLFAFNQSQKFVVGKLLNIKTSLI